MRHYGNETARESSPPTFAVSGDLEADVVNVATFSPAVAHCEVANLPTSGKYLYGRWNALTVRYNATVPNSSYPDPNFVIGPGEQIESPPGIIVSSVALVSPWIVVYGTDYNTEGWD
jgi:hypothetical protein